MIKWTLRYQEVEERLDGDEEREQNGDVCLPSHWDSGHSLNKWEVLKALPNMT